MNTEINLNAAKRTDRLKLALKVALGFVLVVYVLRSRMIDFSALANVLFSPVNLVVGLFFLILSALCSAARWYLLVQAQGLSLSFRSVISLTMIGNFFNTFMPGSVGGDLIKAWYVAGREPQRKTRAIFTVLLDRAIGMSVIIFYAATTLAIYNDWISDNARLRWLAWTLWGFTATVALGIILFYTGRGPDSPLLQKLRALLDRVPLLAKMFDATLQYRRRGGIIAAALALSAISILGVNLMYWIQGQALGVDLTLAQYFFVVPVALTVSAVPLLPGGIGVGQVAFFTLFQWIGASSPEQGATLCTLVQVYTILFNSIGFFFYLRFRRQPAMHMPGGKSGSGIDLGVAAHSPSPA